MKRKNLFALSLAFLVVSAAAFGQSDAERNKGVEMYRAGNYAEAQSIFEKLVEAGEADNTTALYLAAAYVRGGKKAEASAILERLSTFNRRATPIAYENRIRFLKRPRAIYGEAARRTIDKGSVKVLVEFKSDGSIGFAFPFAATSYVLIDGAVKAAKQATFEPATIAGKPVTIVSMFEFHYMNY